MSSADKALETQIRNIQAKTGRNLSELRAHIEGSGLTKHGEIRTMLMKDFGLGFGDANTVVHVVRQAEAESGGTGGKRDVLAEVYAGNKAVLRPIHDKLISAVEKWGEFEVAPKKGYVSLRRKKQFAMIGPGTKGRLEVGLNMKGIEPTDRLLAQAPGGMCQYKVYLSDTKEVDDRLLAWLKHAYGHAG